jgi:hypothetical protein
VATPARGITTSAGEQTGQQRIATPAHGIQPIAGGAPARASSPYLAYPAAAPVAPTAGPPPRRSWLVSIVVAVVVLVAVAAALIIGST